MAASLSDDERSRDRQGQSPPRTPSRHFDLPEHPTAPPGTLRGLPRRGRLEKVSLGTSATGTIAFHSHGAEHRIVDGQLERSGTDPLWIRLTSRLVAEEPLTGVQRAAAAADFGNGVSSAIALRGLPLHQPRPHRAPRHGRRSASGSAWSATRVYGTDTMSTGAGFAESALYDADGRVGRSVQSLFVDPR